MNTRNAFTLIAMLAITVGIAGSVRADSCGSGHSHTTSASLTETEAHGKNIVETAVAAGSFKTLVAAVEAADLVEVLQGDGPFTVFAPTDEAFAKLPKGTIEDLLKPENKKKLQAILTYHVVPGRVISSDVVSLSSAETVQGQKLMIKVDDGMVRIDNALVTAADIQATNGVIHVIDNVILPKL